MKRKSYEYKHIVGYEETNLAGNVYFVNFLRWQGRCREMFLQQHVGSVVDQMQIDFAMVTVHCDCDYFQELTAFDHVIVRMKLKEMTQNRIIMEFDYLKSTSSNEELVARGHQEVACMRRSNGCMLPTAVPEKLQNALKEYTS